ncbi:MAG: hypothetical protein K9I85_08030 [Saprospiraceae bacterium]|nr:hypothetical protein [Saprospiraceae bacterium]
MKTRRIWAHAISILFHPLSVLTYTLVFLLSSNPYVFGVSRMSDKMDLILIVFSTTFLLPALAIFLMVKLQLVNDMQIRERMQRVGPYIAAGVLYSWMTKNLLENADIPPVFATMSLACTLAIFTAFVINVQFKISLHAIGSAGMTSIFVILHLNYPYARVGLDLPALGSLQISLLTMVFLSVIIAGLTGSARLILQVHKPREVFWGYFVGLIIPFIAIPIAEYL